MIMGGVGKNADFQPLIAPLEQYARHVVLIGEAATELAYVLKDRVPLSFANNMDEAISEAATIAVMGDSVLLSPACASFDMFENYEARGRIFSERVKRL
jgi:UDP-N-acetylmuramoylalanine--D-glutamate ligase